MPAGRPPTPAAVSLDEGKLTVRIRITNLAAPGPPGGASIPLAKEFIHQSRYLLDGVAVYDTQGRKVDRKELPKLLEKPVVAFVYHKQQKVDPLFLRLLKPETLTFVLPEAVEVPAAPAVPGVVVPRVPVRPAPAAPPRPATSNDSRDPYGASWSGGQQRGCWATGTSHTLPTTTANSFARRAISFSSSGASFCGDTYPG